jgi:hypothetical protein
VYDRQSVPGRVRLFFFLSFSLLQYYFILSLNCDTVNRVFGIFSG